MKIMMIWRNIFLWMQVGIGKNQYFEEWCRMTAEGLIQRANNKYPLSISYKGRLTSEEVAELEKYCIIHCPSVYMDGTTVYSIRYKGSEVTE